MNDSFNDLAVDDTEARLRDYFQSEAAGVPENAPYPGLPPSQPRHRTWPVVLAAAAVVLVLALAVPLLRSKPTPQPATDLSGLKIPFTLSKSGVTTVHDGGTVVTTDQAVLLKGRVDGGWLVSVRVDGGFRIGVLSSAGELNLIGPAGSWDAVLSGDRRQLAVLIEEPVGTFRIAVYDLASRQELATQSASTAITLAGWNADGIWYSVESGASPLVWTPGEAVRQIKVPDFDGGLAVEPGTDTVVVQTDVRDRWCVQVGKLQSDNTVSRLAGRCGDTKTTHNPVLAPDGSSAIIPHDRTILDIASGKAVPLVGEPPVVDNLPYYYEDTEHILVDDSPQLFGSPDHLYRCGVDDGKCTIAYTAPEGTYLSPSQP